MQWSWQSSTTCTGCLKRRDQEGRLCYLGSGGCIWSTKTNFFMNFFMISPYWIKIFHPTDLPKHFFSEPLLSIDYLLWSVYLIILSAQNLFSLLLVTAFLFYSGELVLVNSCSLSGILKKRYAKFLKWILQLFLLHIPMTLVVFLPWKLIRLQTRAIQKYGILTHLGKISNNGAWQSGNKFFSFPSSKRMIQKLFYVVY